MVPARVGGVDLSALSLSSLVGLFRVPARVGGVDLSSEYVPQGFGTSVPARVGGVDLSRPVPEMIAFSSVPARVGEVDLSFERTMTIPAAPCPRSCGRGGFKRLKSLKCQRRPESPPVWAGWI